MSQEQVDANRAEARNRAKAALHPDVLHAIEEGTARVFAETQDEPANTERQQPREGKTTIGLLSKRPRLQLTGQGDQKGQVDTSGQDLGRLAAAVRESRGGSEG
jgi:hypothetical protein